MFIFQQAAEQSNWDHIVEVWHQLVAVLEIPLFTLGDKHFSTLTIATLLISIIFLFWLANRVRRVLVKRILPKLKTNSGVAESIGTMTRYCVIVFGFVIIFSSVGIDLSTLSILFGALGIGIGFGLQNIANNFISGIIILLENPIKVGDRIQVGDIHGNVTDIRARSTIVKTNDNIDIIMPNSAFIDGQVINWSLNDRNVRIQLPVGVSYKEKPAQIKQLLLEVAADTDGVLDKPAPDVWFVEYADSSINFELVFWTRTYTENPRVLKSHLYYAIFEKFDEHNIEIPFPQRDLHIKSKDE